MAEKLDDWNRGDKFAASHLQQPVTVLRKMLGSPNAGGTIWQKVDPPPERYRFVHFVGRVVDKGPNNEDDYTDERYWVQPMYASGGAMNDVPSFGDAWPWPDEDAETQPATANAAIVTVTNLAENRSATHNLQVGDKVWVFQLYDNQEFPVRHYLMSEGGGVATGEVNWVKIVGTYSGVPVYKCKPLFGVNTPVNAFNPELDTAYTDLFPDFNLDDGLYDTIAVNMLEMGVNSSSTHWINPGAEPNVFMASTIRIEPTGEGQATKILYLFEALQPEVKDCPPDEV